MATSSTAQTHDPLTIHLQRQTQLLASIVSPEAACIAELRNATDAQSFLNTLSTLLSNPAYTQIVATLFRPILMDLCAKWLEDDKNAEGNLCALGFLLEVHEELYPILSRLLQKYFPRGPLASILETATSNSIDTSRVSAILLAYYRILRANRQLSAQRNWSPALLSTLMWTNELEHGIRMLSAKCYAIQVGMGDAESTNLEQALMGRSEDVECSVEYGRELDGTTKYTDGWVLENVEIDRIYASRNKLVTEPIDFYHTNDKEQRVTIQEGDLSSNLASIEGVFLLKSSRLKPTPTNYVPTPSGNETLRSLAHHLSIRVPTLFTSPPSAGKTLLLNHLAAQLYPGTKNQIITIHLADTSLDPRSMLGSYVSSATQPGTFEWKEGVLVRSMREGKWIVLEDIDKGSNEVLGTLKPLVESMGMDKWVGGRASIYVPGRGNVEAHDDFMLFATRSPPPSPNGKFPSATFFGAHKFSETTMHSPSNDELRTIVEAQFPKLAGSLARAAIRMWTSVKGVPRASSSRTIGLRELTKFCQRLESLLPPSHNGMDVDDVESLQPTLASLVTNPMLREDIFLEARDVFFGTGNLTASARGSTDAIAAVIAEHLALDQERCHWLTNKRTPEFHVQKDANGHATGLRVGRTYLPARAAKSDLTNHQTRPFALHRPAVCLLSRVATAISLNEPVLLTGETGTGKTSAITHLASILRRPLVSLNLSNQTESSDLIGGLKPIDAHRPGFELYEEFIELFGSTFSRKKNAKFETEVRKAVNEAKWKRVTGLWKESVRMAQELFKAKKPDMSNVDREQEANLPRKRRKLDQSERWGRFLTNVEQFEVQHVHGSGKFAFGFVEGPLVKAIRNGDWILLDEINLATPETLECITGLLHGPTASITLTENGELEPVPRHPDFRLFACMNPATDVGKKDLGPNIRSRFTEIDVPPPDADKDTLLSIIEQYIGGHAIGDKGAIMNVAEFYMAVKDLVEKRQLADGSNHRPHFSVRSLSRALTFASDIAHVYTLRRAIWEGCLMAFTMVLDDQSAQLVTALAHKYLLAGVRNPRSMLSREPNPPRDIEKFTKFGPFYLERGPLPEDPAEEYIMTPSVEKKLVDLARIILTRKFPVLIEGPTSSGKTSSIEYLAKRTGHHFIRINNHEHTDIQEYLGSYVSDPLTGKLVFRDGLLVQALRNGNWIVLDELNLAPTDVLEALNRLLDDNRELVVPETHEVVRPHPSFMLFATQNPPGLYGGRKVLSRAFRNRFLEVHFDDVPQEELETILCQRCQIAPSYGKKIVAVFRELQKRRESTRVFESKQGFATLRDLFRWAGRDAVGYQELADNGYMLLAERARRDEDKAAVKSVLESIMGVKIDEASLYDLRRPGLDPVSYLGCPAPRTSSVIWTKAMQRLFVLVSRALKFNEPVLLVGETGSGKTSVCQVFADITQQSLRGLNCHQNTETADIIGGLRPLRNRSALQADITQQAIQALSDLQLCDSATDPATIPALVEQALKSSASVDSDTRVRLEKVRSQLLYSQSIFEWYDGPLITAMRDGDVFLLDEISLAEDSVLERLNSVLEPARSIVLAERGGNNLDKGIVSATDSFKLIATMNPGGDYGKKELSPALRNRFTEIWVPRVEDRADLELIINDLWKREDLRTFTNDILDFVEWLCNRVGDKSLLGLRDILAWVAFTNSAVGAGDLDRARHVFHHAAHMTYLDGFGSLPQLSGYSRDSIKRIHEEATQKLNALVPTSTTTYGPISNDNATKTTVRLGPFVMKTGPLESKPQMFTLSAPTTQSNAMRIARACQLSKPVLLEGSPGVGKTSLIAALANITGQELHRINLSDQTDLVDLFGSDLPVEGGRPGEFAWRDGEFLQALQLGHWVLLDEMNLAPQAVLEGLNAVLDHRSTVYIPELGRSFQCHPSFRIFAAQNPLSQGGGRKGLPKSFVNRFTKVYVEELTSDDYLLVCAHLFPALGEDTMRNMISFNNDLNDQVVVRKLFGREGSPWEFNLRDIIRWGTLCGSQTTTHPDPYLHTIYLNRFRSSKDRQRASELFSAAFSTSVDVDRSPPFTISPTTLQVGHFCYNRQNLLPNRRSGRLLHRQLSPLEAIGHCTTQSWLTIVVGSRDSGKTQLINTFAALTGNPLQEIPINNATDTTDILGSFEQVDIRGRLERILDGVLSTVGHELRLLSGSNAWVALCTHESTLRSLRASFANDVDDQLRSARAILLELTEANLSSKYSTYLEELNLVMDSKDTLGRFEWVDGPLTRAMKLGHWVVLDGANLCNPSVLDRLNSLCESNGCLVLSERGFLHGRVQIISPHKDFRLFMLVDPAHGELSRAMRNRGIEISLVGESHPRDDLALRDHLRLPVEGPPHLSTIHFDAVRRGMVTGASVAAELDRVYGLIQRPANSFALSSQLAMLEMSREQPWAFRVPFILRTLVPASSTRLNRYLSTLNFMPNLDQLQDFIQKASRSIHEESIGAFRRSLSYPGENDDNLLLFKPTDWFLATPPTALEQELPSRHRGLFGLLELISLSYLLHDSGRASRSMFEDKFSAANRSLSEGIRHIIATLQSSILRMLEIRLESIDMYTVIAETGTALLRQAKELQEAIQAPVFDFSRAHASVLRIVEVLKDAPPAFSQVAVHVGEVHKALSLTTGSGLIDIWKTYHQVLRKAVHVKVERYGLLSCTNDTSHSVGLRRQIFDVLAVATLPPHSEDSELWTSLEKYIPEGDRESLSTPEAIDAQTLALELATLSALTSDTTKACVNLQAVIRIHLINGRSPITRLIPYQHLAWSLDAKTRSPEHWVRAMSSWLDGVWDMKATIITTPGPTFIYSPVHLIHTVSSSSQRSVPLHQLDTYKNEIQSRIDAVVLQCQESRVPSDMLETLFSQNLYLVASCFAGSFTEEQLDSIISLSGRPKCIRQQIEVLRQSTNTNFRTLVEESISPCFTASGADTAAAWVSLSRVLLTLMIPNIPIDPASVQNATFLRLKEETEYLKSQILLHSNFEENTTGNQSNQLIGYLSSRLESVRAELLRWPKVDSHRNVDRLHQFWAEVTHFSGSVLHASKTEALCALALKQSSVALLQENVLQDSLKGFQHRLETLYEDFADIVCPIKLAILQFRLGLRLMVTVPNAPSSGLGSSIVAFPSISSVDSVVELDISAQSPRSDVSGSILLPLSAISHEVAAGVDLASRMSAVESLYEQLFRIWKIDKAREREVEEQSSTLYRQSTIEHNALTDAELEAQEFLDLFPEFEDALENSSPATKSASSVALVQSQHMVSLLDLHLNLFHTGEGCTSPASLFWGLRKLTLAAMLTPGSTPTNLTSGLDLTSRPFQLALLHEHSTSLLPDATKTKKLPNFYNHSNIPEVSNAIPVVTRMRKRINEIRQEWPDQEVLGHLSGCCNKVTDLDLHSPVAKILAAIEQLLLQSEDWEIYANRDNSLKTYRDELIDLIVRWRRLELASWQSLLQAEADRTRDAVGIWWFRLYDATICGVLLAVQEAASNNDQALDAYLDGLIPLVKKFISTSPIGEYRPRMQLLASFSRYILWLSDVGREQNKMPLSRVAAILQSLHQHFESFSPKLESYLSGERTKLEKEIKNFIKLASWKDINIVTLKQSAKKSHHQLYKTIRKFREVLRQPITSRVIPQFLGDRPVNPSETPAFAANEMHHPLPFDVQALDQEHIRNLGRTYRRFEAIINDNIRPLVQSSCFQVPDELACEIIATSRRLASISCPAELEREKRTKYIKSIQTQKRKAWSDLLKEMRRMGFSSNLKVDVIHDNSSDVWVHGQPSLCGDSRADPIIQKSEHYFNTLQGCLPALRSMFSGHHSDLTTRDVSKGIAITESVFHTAMELRTKSFASSNTLYSSRRIYGRLKSAQTTVLHFYDTELLLHISGVQLAFCRLADALVELTSATATYYLTAKPTGTPAELKASQEHQSTQCRAIRDAMASVHEGIQASPLVCLTDLELQTNRGALSFLMELTQLLPVWQADYPEMDYAFTPFHQWLKTELGSIPSIPNPAYEPTVEFDPTGLSSLVEAFLLSVQPIASIQKNQSQEEDEDKQISRSIEQLRQITHFARLDDVKLRLLDTLAQVKSQASFKEIVPRILPFMEAFLLFALDHNSVLVQWTKSLFKLDYVLCSLMQTLCSQGFCAPPEKSDEEDDGAGGESTAEGVGLGEGSGTENVSKEIEDESQVEGLQGEEQNDKNQAGEEDEKGALEMSEDFSGDLEDAPESDDEEDDDGDSDTSSNADIDEKIEDLDAADPSALDEKLWGDESGPENKDSGEKIDKDHSKESEGKSEMAAKEGKSEKKNQKDQKGDEEEGEQQKEVFPEEDDEMGEQEAGEEEEGKPVAEGAPMDEHVPDANTLDLPEDLNMGDEGDNEDVNMKDDLEDDEDPMDEDIENQISDLDDTKKDKTVQDDRMDEEPNNTHIDEVADDTQTPSDEVEAGQEEQDKADAEEQEDAEDQAKPTVENPNEGGSTNPQEASGEASGDAEADGQAGNSHSAAGQNTMSSEQKASDEGSKHADEHASNTPPEASDTAGAATSGAQEGSKPSQSEFKDLPNPLRSLDDAMNEIQHRFEEILNAEDAQIPRPNPAVPDTLPSQLEYLHPDVEDDQAMQALASADDQKVAKLDDLQFTQDEEATITDLAMDVDQPNPRELQQDSSALEPTPPNSEATSRGQESDVEGAILQHHPPSASSLPALPDADAPEADADQAELNQQAEAELREWRDADHPDGQTENIWRLYESLTHDLAYALCEQLRLILEPTLATRLKGDYRTGKRLNMKKVISYIASDYTKDKIWLRRTKPSQREYQVLVAIDDSRSMAESHSIHLAYESLALIGKALGRLESGDVAIAKFGTSVDLLHGFDEGPFTDQAGAKVISSFRFNQKATNVLSLLETSLTVLDDARERRAMGSSSAADLWQLEIIISDGMCQDHEKLRTVLRRAEEKRIMVVFIILDSLHTSLPAGQQSTSDAQKHVSQRSILNMDRAEYKNVGGRMELQLQKYLDSFPFEYYVVLRDVEALPDVLSSTLKQFFERIAED